MATDWNKILTEIDDDTDRLVHGYSREMESSLNKENDIVIIPPLIIYTILVYY